MATILITPCAQRAGGATPENDKDAHFKEVQVTILHSTCMSDSCFICCCVSGPGNHEPLHLQVHPPPESSLPLVHMHAALQIANAIAQACSMLVQHSKT